MDYPGKVITKTQVTPTQTSASGNWTLDDQAAAIKNNNWPVALVPNPISKSLRFNSADSAYLNRTPASAGNRKTWTFSCWVKKSTTGSFLELLSASTSGGGVDQFLFGSGDTLNYYFSDGTLRFNVVTASVYRDPSAWYHVILAVDTTQATSTNRAKIYVNGTEASLTTGLTYAPQNQDTYINNSNLTAIGSQINGGSNNGLYLNGYMTEVNFIDGQALTPSSFGMTNPQTGQWIPLKYSGTYGTNGFYLNFKDATSTTTLGLDYSGNANNWTTNNFSVTAGAGNDSLTDVPTPWIAYNTTGDVGGVIRGNYATLNPLSAGSAAQAVLTNGNLDFGNTSSSGRDCWATITPQSGKWYWESTAGSNSGTPAMVVAVSLQPGDSKRVRYNNDGTVTQSGLSGTSGTGSFTSYTTNDVIGVAFDVDSKSVKFYKNNTLQTTVSWTDSDLLTPYVSGLNFTSSTNFGQRPFAYTPPTGFRSLCTTNLPATAIGFGLTNQGDDYFNVNLWTGTGATQSITTGFPVDFAWIKSRTTANGHRLFDIVRGATISLFSNSTAAESTESDSLTAFTSTGYTLGADTAGGGVNTSPRSYVGWAWKAGGTGVSNTAGTITSTVSANTTAGFSIVTYTGNGSSSATVGHGLGVAPDMVIVKARNNGSDWEVFHRSLSASNGIRLNTTAAQFAASSTVGGIISTSPTSTTFGFTAGTSNVNNVNENGVTWVAYCFDAVPGYSAFGSYTGNGSTDGPFIYTGFRPAWVMFRNSGAIANWWIYDTKRNTYNVMDLGLRADLSNAELTYTFIDCLSNGFKLRNTGSDGNGSGATMIYAAFAESPFQFSNAR